MPYKYSPFIGFSETIANLIIIIFLTRVKEKQLKCYAPLLVKVRPTISSSKIVLRQGEKHKLTINESVIERPNLESQSASMFSSLNIWLMKNWTTCSRQVRISLMICWICQGICIFPSKIWMIILFLPSTDYGNVLVLLHLTHLLMLYPPPLGLW